MAEWINFFPDEAEEPTSAAIQHALGSTAGRCWTEIEELFEADGLKVVWKWYRDGGPGWLARVIKGKTTICWLAIKDEQKGARVSATFYFAERLRPDVATAIPKRKPEIMTAPKFGSVFPVPVEIRTKADLANFKEVYQTRLKLK